MRPLATSTLRRLRPDTLALTVVLALLTALGPLSTDMYLPSLPDIAIKLDTTTARTQLTLSVFLLGFACGQVFYGPVSDRFGRRPVLMAGMGLFVVATALCALATSIDMLIGARFLQALGASGPNVLGRAIVRDLYDGPRAGRELARMGTIMGVVPAIAPVLGGVLQAGFGWRASFLVSVAGAMALAVIVAIRLPETLRAPGSDKLSLGGIGQAYRALLAHRAFRVYAGLIALAYSGLFAFISGSSFVLQGIYGLGEVVYGFVFGFMVLGFITGTILARRLIGSRGLDGTIAIGVAFLAGGGIAMLGCVLAGIGGVLGIAGPMALYACGVGLTLPQALASAMQPFPNRAGAASSLVGLAQMTLAALVGAALGHAIGADPTPMPAVIAGLGIGAFILFHASARARTASA